MGSHLYKRITLVLFNTPVFQSPPKKGAVVSFFFWLRWSGRANRQALCKALDITGKH
jgi:hypothetical protein